MNGYAQKKQHGQKLDHIDPGESTKSQAVLKILHHNPWGPLTQLNRRNQSANILADEPSSQGSLKYI